MMDDLNRVAGDLGVRRTLARLSDSIFRRDRIAHGECYAENGEWHAFGVIMRGRQAVVDHWWAVMQGFPFVRQDISSLVIEGPHRGVMSMKPSACRTGATRS